MVSFRDVPATWRASLGRTLGLLLSGTFGWLLVCSVELRALPVSVTYTWIALAHLLRVSLTFSLAGAAAVTVLAAVRSLVGKRLRGYEWITLALVALGCAPQAWRTAEALLGGGMFGDAGYGPAVIAPIAAVFVGVYLALWIHHLVLCHPPGVAWPDWLERVLARIPEALRTWSSWLVGTAALVALIVAIDHELRAYLFVARYLLPAAWLLAATLVWSLVMRASSRARKVMAATGVLLTASAVLVPLPDRGLSKVRGDIIRLAGAASLSDFSATRQRNAQLAGLDFSRPERFDCRERTRTSPAAPRGAMQRNVILISVDALRKDAITMQQGNKRLMPNLARFASESISFERAVTTYPATLFAIGAALTGLGPSEVLFAPDVPQNVISQAKDAVEDRNIFLRESSWFRKISIQRLFMQQTATVFSASDEQSTSRMIALLRRARAQNRRVFAWLHLYEPHILTKRGKTASGRRADYREQIQVVDEQLGRVMRTLNTLKYYDDSLILLFSDHGEALGEFGFVGHHVYLNHFMTDVPLLMRVPGEQPRRDKRTTTIADIAPTIQQWLGLPVHQGDARSLLDPPPEPDTRYVVSEAFPLRGAPLFELARRRIETVSALRHRVAAVRQSTLDYSPKVAIATSRYRLIVDRDTGAEELYDRDADPLEERNLADQRLPIHTELKRALTTWVARQSESIYCAVVRATGSPITR